MKNETMDLRLATVAKCRDKYFLTPLNMNALFVYEQEKGNLSYLDSFQIEREVFPMYIRSFLYKEEIWFLPAEAEKIAILDTCNMQIEYIAIDYHDGYNGSGARYNNFLRFYDHYVCFVPRCTDEAVIINMETKKIENYYKLTNRKEEFQNAFLLDDTLYFYPWKGEKRVSLNLLSKKINYEKWENDEEYGDSVYDKKSGNIFHAPSRKNYVLVSDIQGKIIGKKTSDCPLDKEGYRTFYSSIDNQKILFWGGKGVITVDPKEFNVQYTEIRESENEGMLIPIDLCPQEAFLFCGNQIFRYDNIQKKYISMDITIKVELLLNQIGDKGKHFSDLYKYAEHAYEMENEPFTWGSFIRLFDFDLSISHTEKTAKKNQKSIGYKIFQYCLTC